MVSVGGWDGVVSVVIADGGGKCIYEYTYENITMKPISLLLSKYLKIIFFNGLSNEPNWQSNITQNIKQP